MDDVWISEEDFALALEGFLAAVAEGARGEDGGRALLRIDWVNVGDRVAGAVGVRVRWGERSGRE